MQKQCNFKYISGTKVQSQDQSDPQKLGYFDYLYQLSDFTQQNSRKSSSENSKDFTSNLNQLNLKEKNASSQNNPIRTANVDQLQLAFDQFITTNRLRKNSLPAQQQNTEDSMTSQDSGLQNFLFYNQDQFPADLNKAIMHGQAQRVCKAINYNYYHGRRCECCGKAIDNQQLSMCDHPNSMKHIGNCYPLYFLFVKQCFIFVLIQLFVQAVPTLIVYSRKDRKTVSDYSIIIKDFPSNVPLEALEDILEKNVPGSKKQIVRMFLLYDLRSYSEGRKERKKIIDKINYLQMKNSLFQNNPNFTVTQKINRQETCDMEIAVLESQKECIEDQLHEITQMQIQTYPYKYVLKLICKVVQNILYYID
ncbi:hypothetical protein PPERSA_09565 [Pseudocohnilembus persalinus]|uniref:Uncharacterized protein n=1 Tax=Pseudocohnilembus persalinus TaxID=266149 RepID=A0A0V0QFH6_PSEPJ|nr:hypothetical protein PPERSA_09565 [Pseudocohnilembus persalinus]|eukprot:KRX00959.1 hypothetical protein PPERSA_09565 [Pseudocohnilembus persalinus]